MNKTKLITLFIVILMCAGGKLSPQRLDKNTEIQNLLKDIDQGSYKASKALTRLAELGEVSYLITALEHKSNFVRTSAAISLGNMGPKAKKATEDLIKVALKDVNDFARMFAGKALGEINPKEATPKIIDIALTSRSDRWAAFEALKNMGVIPKVTPQFKNILKSKNDGSKKMMALDFFKTTGASSIDAIPEILHIALTEPESGIQGEARLTALVLMDGYPQIKEKGLVILKESLKTREEMKGLEAAFLLTELEEYDEGISYLVEALRSKDPKIRDGASAILSQLHDKDITPLIKEKFESALEKVSRTEEKDLCSIVCHLAENIKKDKIAGQDESGVFEKPHVSLAISSLNALFLTKAEPFCKSLKGTKLEMISSVISGQKKETPEECPTTPPFRQLKQQIHEALKVSLSLSGSPLLYGKQFYILAIKELLNHPSLTEIQKNSLLNELEKIKNALTEDIQSAEKLTSARGSVFNTYALATSLLSVSDERGLALLNEQINPTAPLEIRYSPGGPYDKPEGSVARAVPVYLALYKNETDPSKKETYRNLLKKSIKFYSDQFVFLTLHIRRKDTHAGEYALAPYYLYSSLPYVTAATQLLMEEKRGEEQRELGTLQNDLKSKIVSLIDKDGFFETEQYFPETYHNQMGALTLMPLMDECGGEGVPPSLGILP